MKLRWVRHAPKPGERAPDRWPLCGQARWRFISDVGVTCQKCLVLRGHPAIIL